MEIIFTPKALSDLNDLKKSGNISLQKKIKELLQAIQESPYTGVGKPEALKYELSGKWSRRINHEHRLIYSINNNQINVYSLKGHY
jgi:toxin YoeB